MIQLMLALTFFGGFLPEGTPPVASPKILSPGKELATSAKQTNPVSLRAQLRITEETEILLDGLACRYEQVPESAVITFAEVGVDRETVRRIHFRSQK
jgi:hypothetical protein